MLEEVLNKEHRNLNYTVVFQLGHRGPETLNPEEE